MYLVVPTGFLCWSVQIPAKQNSSRVSNAVRCWRVSLCYRPRIAFWPIMRFKPTQAPDITRDPRDKWLWIACVRSWIFDNTLQNIEVSRWVLRCVASFSPGHSLYTHSCVWLRFHLAICPAAWVQRIRRVVMIMVWSIKARRSILHSLFKRIYNSNKTSSV